MVESILAFIAIWWQPIAMAAVVTFMIWYSVHSGRQLEKWNNAPEQVAKRQKDAYDAAHAYLGGRPCCGRDQIKD